MGSAALLESYASASVMVFGSVEFSSVKRALKAELNQDQGGLCVYCEKHLAPHDGQVEHIKPKSGPHKRPDLCFNYQNWAHSCIHANTCGQQKKGNLLPIEPEPGCNTHWFLSVDGSVTPKYGLDKALRHAVTQTCNMLGLNHAELVAERRKHFENLVLILKEAPAHASEFLHSQPYRFILATAL